MPETGGAGVIGIVCVGIVLVGCGVGLACKKTRKMVLSLMLVSLVSMNVFAANDLPEIEIGTIGVRLSCLNPNTIHSTAVCDVALPDVERGFEPSETASGRGEYTVLLSDWLANPELVFDMRALNVGGIGQYSRLVSYSYVVDDSGATDLSAVAFREKEFSVIDSSSKKCALLAVEDATTVERWSGYFDYFTQPTEHVDFRMRFSDGYMPDCSVRDDVSFDVNLQWSLDVIQDHNISSAALSAWGIQFDVSDDGHISLARYNKRASRFLTSYVKQEVVVHVIDDRCLEISKTVTEDLS